MHIGNLFPIYSLLIRQRLGIDMLYDLGVSALLSTMPGSHKFSFLTRICVAAILSMSRYEGRFPDAVAAYLPT